MKKEFDFKHAKRVGEKFKDKEVKVSVTAHLDPKVVAWLRRESDRKRITHHAFMNSLLTEVMNAEGQKAG